MEQERPRVSRQEIGSDARNASVSECIDRNRHALQHLVERRFPAVVFRRTGGFCRGSLVPNRHLRARGHEYRESITITL